MYRLITTPGRAKLRIPTVLTSEEDTSSAIVSRSPEWMISIDALCKGTVEGFAEYIHLFGWFSESSHYIDGDVAGSMFSSGSIRNSGLVFIIPNGEHVPKIEQQLYRGKLVDKLIIVRLGWTEDKNEILQQVTFGGVRFIRYQQNVQYLVVHAQITSKENDIQIFKQKDGSASGHKISSVEYDSNKLKLS
ncbi:MAG: hypothetical protein LBJ89_03100 [Holosporales bacterium]|jgi:hypothetical protein|nr:hypothetical protein [Holosporales bacterium]